MRTTRYFKYITIKLLSLGIETMRRNVAFHLYEGKMKRVSFLMLVRDQIAYGYSGIITE